MPFTPQRAEQLGSELFVFADDRVVSFSGGRRTYAFSAEARFIQVVRVRRPEDGTWLLGLLSNGKVVRVVPGIGLDDTALLSFGISSGPILGIGSLGDRVAFATKDALFVSGAGRVVSYALKLRELRAGGDVVAGLETGDWVTALDLASGHVRRYSVPHSRTLGVDGFGRLAVLAGTTVWLEEAGRLEALLDPVDADARLDRVGGHHVLASSRDAYRLPESGPRRLSERLTGNWLGPSEYGGWVQTTRGVEEVLPIAGGSPSPFKDVAAIIARRCVRCHGSTDGRPLDTEVLWRRSKDRIFQRVVVERAMPPDEAMPEGERRTLANWIQGLQAR